MTKKITEGLILSTLNFRDYDQILTVFTKNLGLIKMIVPRANSRRSQKGTSFNPFVIGEFIYSEQRNSMLRCHEISIVNYQLKLRERLEWLKISAQILHLIQKTQLEAKPTPLLYQLTVTYLENIPLFFCLKTLYVSFYLKTLIHEGLYPLNLHCSACDTPLQNSFIYQQNPFCAVHAPPLAIFFELNELLLFSQIAHCRSFKKLGMYAMSSSLYEKFLKAFEFSDCGN